MDRSPAPVFGLVNDQPPLAADSADRRRRLRRSVKQSCHAGLEGRECDGAVVDPSVAGAAIHRIGLSRSRAVQALSGGGAVEFLFNPADDRTLIARLCSVFNDYTPNPKPA